ncbi:MAG: gamma-glutamyl kinase [Rhizobium sp.]|nr:gamma-glutamyl kinase [Rhizobium sp.]
MIFLYRAKLLILSQPKTGTTALDNALAHRASIVVNSPPEMKHLAYRKFMKFVAPWIRAQTGLTRKQYEVVSVMREPIDWLGSWYRYRTRERLNNPDADRPGNYTGNVSFDQFILDVCKPKREQPSYAHINSPCSVALNGEDSVGIDRIFPYEDMSGLYELIEERTGKSVDTKQMNVSPEMKLEISDEARARIKEKLAFAFELHGSLRKDGFVDSRFRLKGNNDEGDAED